MNPGDEQHIAARLATIIAMPCSRNAPLEEMHAGPVPVTRTGDLSDALVGDALVGDAGGQRIPWPEVSRLGAEDPARRARMDR
jgi:hypothetical protein